MGQIADSAPVSCSYSNSS